MHQSESVESLQYISVEDWMCSLTIRNCLMMFILPDRKRSNRRSGSRNLTSFRSTDHTKLHQCDSYRKNIKGVKSRSIAQRGACSADRCGWYLCGNVYETELSGYRYKDGIAGIYSGKDATACSRNHACNFACGSCRNRCRIVSRNVLHLLP